jgi:GTP cyclohydrolase I
MKQTVLTNIHVDLLASDLANLIIKQVSPRFGVKIYPIPRGGIPAAYAVGRHLNCRFVDKPCEADAFIDDILDTGKTSENWKERFPNTPFYALIDKKNPVHISRFPGWVVFPWEGTSEAGITDNITRILEFVGDDPTRGGLAETPNRVAKAWQFWCSGYDKDPAEVLKTFEDGAEKHDQMITVKDIPIYSHCEHHMAAIFGTITISYIPNGKIVGLSKLSRLTDIFARRLQVQERMTDQIADALYEHLKPKGVGVVIKARHMCMESRGVCQQGHHTITTALRGNFKEFGPARAEFLNTAI